MDEKLTKEKIEISQKFSKHIGREIKDYISKNRELEKPELIMGLMVLLTSLLYSFGLSYQDSIKIIVDGFTTFYKSIEEKKNS